MRNQLKEKQVFNLQVTEELSVAVTKSNDFEFTLPTKEVAKGYGVKESSVRDHRAKHSDELIEGKHFIYLRDGKTSSAKNQYFKKMYWTKAGIVRLGFFIKSENAKMFRTWAENLILDKMANNPTSLPEHQSVNVKIVNGYKVGVITEDEQEWYKLRDLFPVFGYKTSNTTNLLPRLPKHTYKQLYTHINGNFTEWYINHDGIINFMFSAQKSIPVSVIEIVQAQLLNINLPLGPDIQYPYKFTHEQINNLFYEVSKIDKEKLTQNIHEIIRGGRV